MKRQSLNKYRTVLITLSIFLVCAMSLVAVFAADGDLDLTFDTDGMLTTDFAGQGDVANGIVVQPDGKIVVAGAVSVSSLGNFGLARYNPDGSPDTNFDGDGKVTTLIGIGASANAVALQPDGKIVVAGIGRPVGQFDFDFVLARYNTNGSLDTTFNSTGTLITRFSTADDDARAVVIQPDGKIIVAGQTFSTSPAGFALARYNADGSLDTSFDTDGKLTTTFAPAARANEVFLQPDGKIVAAGNQNLARYNPNGSLDSTFGTGGRVLINNILIWAAALQTDGNIVVAGRGTGTSGFADFALARITTAGVFETTFGNNGRVFTDFGNENEDVNQVLIQTNGKIIAVGATGALDGSVFALARYNADGSLDTGFSGDGKTTTDFVNPDDAAFAAVLQTDGKIIAAGRTGLNSPADFAVARYQNSDSTVVPHRTMFDFDGDGKTDVGIFRPAPAEWWYLKSSDNQVFAAQFGASSDIIAPADFTGDGKTDIAFWRPSSGQWFVLRSEDSSFFAFPFGQAGDIPVPADYDGDNRADAAVFRPLAGTWFVNRSTDGGVSFIPFGNATDLPVPADYDGDGKADVAIFRPNGANGAEWWIQRSSAGLIALQFGASTDKATPGDFTGDGKADVAFWRPATGEWFVLRSEDLSFFAFPFGANGDIPAPGDYDGDGRIDATVYRPSSATWFSQLSTSGVLIVQFGLSGDRPIPNAFVP